MLVPKLIKKTLITIMVTIGVTVISQGIGTPSQLRVITDSTSTLLISSAVQVLSLLQPTVFINTRIHTDLWGVLDD